MKKMLCALMSALLFVVLLGSLAVPAVAFTPTAEAPEWEEGDRWGFGADTDMGAAFDEILTNLTNMLELTDQVDSVEEMSIDGETGFWMLFEVTQVTDDNYVMSMSMATMMSLSATVSITADMPEEGNYSYEADPPTDLITVSAELNAEMALVVKVDVTFDRSTMAIEAMNITAKLSVAVDLKADNFPRSESDWWEDWQRYWYEDYDVSGELKADLALNIVFNPGLNLWDFPLFEGDSWVVESTATVSGTLTGSLDIVGLPEEMEEDIFSEGFVNETGITGFPIVFEDIGDLGQIPFDNGVIEQFTTPEFSFDVFCTDYFILESDNFDDIAVYEMRVGSIDSPVLFYFSPDLGFMAMFSMDTEGMGGIMDQFPIGDMTTMQAVDPAVAEQRINEISDFQSGVGQDEDGIASFFTDPPYLGIILVAVIAIVIVAAVLLVRKK